MRRLTLLTLLTLTIAVPLQASRSKHQSYISYDDGGTIVRQGEDGREVDSRVNLPVFPGDEVITNRRGRVEIRLSDGNVLGLDRSTAVRFHSMLDNYEGESAQTVVEVLYGHVIVNRPDADREFLRLDTKNASYVAMDEAIYSVDTDADGRDRIAVFDGSIEVRTPERTTRLREGEGASVDDRGLYGLVSDDDHSADDFERWFLRRAERFNQRNSRYLDRSIAHYEDDLDDHGSWIYVSGYGGYAWRPRVGAGWRPYYYGHWNRSRYGCLTWVSYEPWGWAPYHYGRWAHDPLYGWVWMPGIGYSPAWVYWMYGPSYIGWAPAGWYDCYRPYYNWAYRPYSTRADFGFGFYGRVRVNELDLRPWTFVDTNTIVSNRVDRAALTTDAIRERLQRAGDGGLATVAGGANRFTREELRDPAAAINRRGLVGGTGREPGSPAGGDITPFFRRDPDLNSNVRERIVRGRETGGTPSGRTGGTTAGGLAPIGGGNLAPIGGGNVAPIGGGNVAPIGGGNVAPTTRGEGGRVNRGGDWRSTPPPPQTPSTPSATDRIGGRVSRGGETPSTPSPSVTPRDASPTPDWRDRLSKDREKPADKPSAGSTPSTSETPRGDTSWRDRVSRGNEGRTPSSAPREKARDSGSSDAPPPRRVIDRIGGARVSPDRGGSSSGGGVRSTPPPRQSSPPPPPPKSDGGSKSGGGGEGKVKRDQ